MPFTINIDPALLRIGGFEIRYYGLVYVVGFLIAYWVLQQALKKGMLALNKDEISDFIFYLMLGTVIGARIVHVISGYDYYLANPALIFAVWKGGMALYGGIAGAFIASYLYCRKKGQSLAVLADLVSPYAALMLGFGRLTNLINGELYGTVTNASWCVYLTTADGCRHPYQLYAAFGFFAIAAVLFWLSARVPQKKGSVFWYFLLLVSISRLAIDFWKEAPRLLGLNFAQYLSIATIGLVIAYRRYKP